MSKKQVDHIIRVWKDQDYRESLSEEERAELPEHPSGWIGLDKLGLKDILGGGPTLYKSVLWQCNSAVC